MNTITPRSQTLATRLMAALRRRTGLLIAGAALALGSSGAMAYSLDFVMVNRTDQPIVAMWAVPTGSSTWGSAFENTFVSEAGGRQNVNFKYPGYSTDDCTFSIKVRFAEGAERYWTGYNLCTIKGLQIYVSNGEVRAATW